MHYFTKIANALFQIKVELSAVPGIAGLIITFYA